MFFYRVTKYDPHYRDANGFYTLKDEWYLYEQIGETFEDKVFTYEEYLITENSYVEAIFYIMKFMHIHSLRVISPSKTYPQNFANLGKSKAKKNSFYTPEIIRIAHSVTDEMRVFKKNIDILARLALRENMGFQLENSAMRVHFGWDYYMYIATKQEFSKKEISAIEKMHLFVEPCTFPYDEDKKDNT